MPPVEREIALRLAELRPLRRRESAPEDRAKALSAASELLMELPDSLDKSAALRQHARLREAWEPVRGRAMADRISRLLGPAFREAARREALASAVHRLTLPLGMLSRELPRYNAFAEAAGALWPMSSFGWKGEEGRWEPVDWEKIERLLALLQREPTVERLARTISRSAKERNGEMPPGPKGKEAGDEGDERAGKPPAALASSVRGGAPVSLEEELLLRHRRMMEEVVRSANSLEQAERPPHPPGPTAAPIEEDYPRHGEWQAPVALVLDTTGSMRGEPESVARALAFGLALHALSRERPVHISAFATSVESLILEPPAPAIWKLPPFLDDAFATGAAAVPALRHILRQGMVRKWNQADIVFVTDSREARLSPTTEEQLAELRRRSDVRLHGLTINELPMINSGNLFDLTWHYSSSRTLSPGISSEQFRNM